MKKLLLVLILVVTPGCAIFSSSHPKMAEVWPVYQLPAKPQLDMPATVVPNKSPELDAMIKNVYALTQAVDTLRIIVDTHNAAAKAHNQAVEAGLGVGK